MDYTAKSMQNNALAALTKGAPQHVLNSIKQASARTGVNFAYLVQQANVESSFRPAVKAKTSSASGLYQFIESTWLNMVKKHGAAHGMADMAAQIGKNGKVADKAMRKEILALRNDPEKASAMAAELASDNREFLENNWGGKVGATELYMAHFMGAGGAAAFLKAQDKNPLQEAAIIFPEAAKSNRNVFYDTATGRAKSVAEVYAFFDRKFEVKDGTLPGLIDSPVQVAAKAPSASPAPVHTAKNDTYEEMKSVVFTPDRHNFAARAYGSLYSSKNALPTGFGMLANPVELMMLGQATEADPDKNLYFF